MTKASLVATLMTPPSAGGDELATLPRSVEWLEVRADLTGDISPDWLRARFRGRLLYTLRSRAEGGQSDDSEEARRHRLLLASKEYDAVDIEGERDTQPSLLRAIPPDRRFISWHGKATNHQALFERLERFSSIGASIYRLVPRAERVGEEMAPLTLLRLSGRRDLVAYASGHIGFWSRLVAPRFGAPLVFAVPQKTQNSNGEPTISQLIGDYGLPALNPISEIYGIVGNPVFHSLSPRLHNAAYKLTNRPALYVPFHVESFAEFWNAFTQNEELESLGISLRGLTVASPHKEAALEKAGGSTSLVRHSGSTNLFIRTNGIWTADTTDSIGVLLALDELGVTVRGKRVAVVGCGGSGRPMAVAMDHAGASVLLVNRGLERGELAVKLSGLPFVPLSQFSPEGFAIVVNATPVGRDDGQFPFSLEGLGTDTVIVDLVYGSTPTPLVTSAREAGLRVIDGRDVLLTQVRRQFQLMTGSEMPKGLASELLGRGAETAYTHLLDQ